MDKLMHKDWQPLKSVYYAHTQAQCWRTCRMIDKFALWKHSKCIKRRPKAKGRQCVHE